MSGRQAVVVRLRLASANGSWAIKACGLTRQQLGQLPLYHK